MTVLVRRDEVVVVAPPGESAVLSVQQIRDLDRALAGAAANTTWPMAVSGLTTMTRARRSDPDSPDVDESLRQAVLHRLTALEQIAEDDTDLAAHLPLARSELSRLADGWRLLLTVHGVGEDGRCRACPGWVRHHRRWPCPVWLMAHQHLLGDAPAGRPRYAGRHPVRDALRWLDHVLGRSGRTR